MIYAGIVLCAIVGFLGGYICGFLEWPKFIYIKLAQLADKITPHDYRTGGN